MKFKTIGIIGGIFLMLFSSCADFQKLPTSDSDRNRVIEQKGKSSSELYLKIKRWLMAISNDYGQIVSSEDSLNHSIMGRAYMNCGKFHYSTAEGVVDLGNPKRPCLEFTFFAQAENGVVRLNYSPVKIGKCNLDKTVIRNPPVYFYSAASIAGEPWTEFARTEDIQTAKECLSQAETWFYR